MVLRDSTGNLRKMCEKGAVTEEKSSSSERRHSLAQTGGNINTEEQMKEASGEGHMRGNRSLDRAGADWRWRCSWS